MSEDAQRVALAVAVVTPHGQRDLLIEADPSTPAAAVAARLAAECGVHPSARVHVPRLDATLTGEGPISSIGLVQGDLLTVATRVAASTGAGELVPHGGGPSHEIRIVGGAAAGQRRRLGEAWTVIGRDPSSDFCIDDPTLSRHHLSLAARDGEVVAVDDGSTNGTLLDGAPLEGRRVVAPSSVLRAGRTLVAAGCAPPHDGHPRPRPGLSGHVPFNRPPRVARPYEPPRLVVGAPPDLPRPTRVPLSASLAPLVLGIGAWLITGSLIFLLFMALSPFIAVWSLIEDRRGGKRQFEKQKRAFRDEVRRVVAELDTARESETARRREADPDLAELVDRARRARPSLWERRPDDDDFLRLRLGSADLPSSVRTEVGAGGVEGLRHEAVEALAASAVLSSVPVALSLREVGVLGICGRADSTDAMGRALVAQAAVLHSPRELVIAAALAEESPGWEWLKWLPHTGRAGLGMEPLARGHARSAALVEALREEVAARRSPAGMRAGAHTSASVLLVLDERLGLDRALVEPLLAQAGSDGLAVVWLGRDRRDLPGACRAVVEHEGELARLSLTLATTGAEVADVTADWLSAALAQELGRSLSPMRDTSQAHVAATIPSYLGLLELLDLVELEDPTARAIHARWEAGTGHLRAPIGRQAGGDLLIDLRRDGPHALLGGTTGSGKSELLLSFVAALAASHDPRRLNLLLIDYKGGAAFRECTKLPHTVGFVTDLDEHLTRRALVSLNAELRHRERVLHDAGAKDLLELERRAPPDGRAALASLVIVVDEFATLVKEVPAFVDGIVDVAQRGRSLGVHVVLATQRPQGAVTPGIRANTNLRVALRMSEPVESEDVIGSALAARIGAEARGRAYARVGQSQPVEFQAAYAGHVSAASPSGDGCVVRPFVIGHPGERLSRPEGAPEASGASDLARLISVVAEAARENGTPTQRSPWLPALPAVTPLESLDEVGPPGRQQTRIDLGTVDEPERQRQEPLRIDLETEGSLLVYGAGGSGKTTFLRTLGAALARAFDPERVHLYGLDCGTRGLAALEALPHCGAVVNGEETERVEKLFRLLAREMASRKATLARAGVLSLSEFERVGGGDAPARIVVLLDDYSGFTSLFERVNAGELIDTLPRLVADGRPLGIHFAITAGRRTAVPTALAGVVSWRMVLRMASEDEFAMLGLDPKLAHARLPAGRGFLTGGREAQVALLGGTAEGDAQVSALRDLGSRLRADGAEHRVPPIGTLPEVVTRERLPPSESPLHAWLGLSDDHLGPVGVEFDDAHFLVVGPYRSGRSTALETLARGLADGHDAPELHLLSPKRSPLRELELFTGVARGAEECLVTAQRLHDRVSGLGSDADERLVIVIDNAEELADGAAATALEAIVRRGRDAGVRVVASVERQALRTAFGGWLRELRKDEHGLLLVPNVDMDGDLLGAQLPRRSNAPFPPGRGYLVCRGRVELVQVARS